MNTETGPETPAPEGEMAKRLPEYLDPVGKFCDCGHPAWASFEWRIGAFSGFKCVHCISDMWLRTRANIDAGLAELPESCEAR